MENLKQKEMELMHQKQILQTNRIKQLKLENKCLYSIISIAKNHTHIVAYFDSYEKAKSNVPNKKYWGKTKYMIGAKELKELSDSEILKINELPDSFGWSGYVSP